MKDVKTGYAVELYTNAVETSSTVEYCLLIFVSLNVKEVIKFLWQSHS